MRDAKRDHSAVLYLVSDEVARRRQTGYERVLIQYDGSMS